MRTHYAMIGMAYVGRGIRSTTMLSTRKGLCIAGLNFVGNAACQSGNGRKDNISVFGLIPGCGQCADLNEVRPCWPLSNLLDIHLTPSCHGKAALAHH